MGKERLEFCMGMRAAYPELPGVHSSVNVPEWVVLGRNVTIHAGVTLGSQGFGFERDPESGEFLHIPHVGKLIIGDDVEIFEGTNVCRGTVGDTVIGRGTKIDALCHIGHNAVIGKNCVITAKCMVGGVVLGDNVWVGPNTVFKQKVNIAEGVLVGQDSNVLNDIVEPYTVWAGNPARFLRKRGPEE